MPKRTHLTRDGIDVAMYRWPIHGDIWRSMLSAGFWLARHLPRLGGVTRSRRAVVSRRNRQILATSNAPR